MYLSFWQKLGSVEVTTNNIKTVLLLISSPELGIVCKACEAVLSYMQKCKYPTNIQRKLLLILDIHAQLIITTDKSRV